MENATMPILVPISSEEFWSQIRAIIREEIGNAQKREKQPVNQMFYTPGLTTKPLYKINEVCALFHITRPTVYEWIRQGRLKAHKIQSRVFFLQSDIEQLLQRSD